MKIKCTGISIYPLKSTSGIELESSFVEAKGLKWDRRWMLVDEKGLFITGRAFPQLTLVKTQIDVNHMIVHIPGRAAFQVPLTLDAGKLMMVSIWKDKCEAIVVSEMIDQYFSDFLKVKCHFVFMSESFRRPVDPVYSTADDHVSFADGFPLLLVSEASLASLNEKMNRPISMKRFRPNIVVSGCDAFDEDSWKKIRIGEVEFNVSKPCSRCVFTTVDPETGDKDTGKEPLKTLMTFRRGHDGAVYFGQNMVPTGEGIVSVHDQVEVLA